MGSRAMIYIPSFIKNSSGIEKLKGGGRLGFHRHTDSTEMA
jgi:hypothetical protein